MTWEDKSAGLSIHYKLWNIFYPFCLKTYQRLLCIWVMYFKYLKRDDSFSQHRLDYATINPKIWMAFSRGKEHLTLTHSQANGDKHQLYSQFMSNYHRTSHRGARKCIPSDFQKEKRTRHQWAAITITTVMANKTWWSCRKRDENSRHT